MCLAARAAVAVEPLPSPPGSAPLYWRLKASLGYHYSVGDYGESESTEIHYVPLALTGEVERWMLQLTIPFLAIRGPSGIIEGPSGPIASEGDGDGLGDLLLRGGYLVPLRALLAGSLAANPALPYPEIIGLVKFPTASRDEGLGTGEFDFGLELELSWALGRFTPFATAGYRFLGSPPGTHLSDVFVGSLGGIYRLFESLDGGVLFDYRQSPSPSTGERLELVPFATWRFRPPWSIDTYVSGGLADGSPEVGVGFQVAYTY
jgi:hypothetical protein